MNINKIAFTSLVLFTSFLGFGSLRAMHREAEQHVDANGYRYANENQIRNKRKIAILSYGSLVRQAANQQTNARLLTEPFFSTDSCLPVSLMRLSNGPRITAVIDRDGELKRVWAATSIFTYLPNARNNLAAREGCRLIGQERGYDLSRIFYMKKLLPGQNKDANEGLVSNTARWVISEASEQQQLPLSVAQNLARWADEQGYSALIWASFPANIASEKNVIERLLSDETLLRNTQSYIQNLPDGPQSAFERAVMDGRGNLDILLHRYNSQAESSSARLDTAGANSDRSLQTASSNAQPDRSLHYENFCYYQCGDLPIILTAPHGGKKDMGMSQRTGVHPEIRSAIPLFETVCDDGTLELTLKISDEIYALTGFRPYMVCADFSRKIIDANRKAGIQAYEKREAKPVYDFYHGHIKNYISEINSRYSNRTLLIDVHGQGVHAQKIFRGTRNRSTIARLLERSGESAFTGAQSLLDILHSKGYSIDPLNDARDESERRMFAGGHTVATYGSHNADGIDAIQFECGRELRITKCDQFAKDMARAIVEFAQAYLSQR